MKMIVCTKGLKYVINSEEIRRLCIKYDLYTSGDGFAYEDMLKFCDKVSNSHESIDLDDAMYSVALDILKHSDISNFYSDKEAIAFILKYVVGKSLDIEIKDN